jgi:hypothetical protein
MHRSRGIRIRSTIASSALSALLVVGLAACGSSDDDADATTTEATTDASTTAPAEAEEKVRSKVIEDFAATLEGAGFDAETQECILGVAEDSIVAQLSGEELDQAYQDACGLSSVEVMAGTYYAAFLERGIEEQAAACARDLLVQLPYSEVEAFAQDIERGDALLEGCGIDPEQARNG